MESNNLEEFLHKVSARMENPLSIKTLITNCILTSKRLIVEIESLEDKILKMNEKDQNMLLLLGAKFELLLHEVMEMSNSSF